MGENSAWPPTSRDERTGAARGVTAGAGLPRVAGLDLDTLLEQLVAGARDGQETQGRLCRLLRANLAVASGVDLGEVLRHIVDAAREDEDLLAVLAAAAGIAIENARMFVECRRRQQWQAGVVAITTQLLTAAEPDQALRQMVQHALLVSEADGASVTVPTDEPGRLRVAVAEGRFRRWEGEIFPVDGSASAIAMAERRPVRVADLSSDPRIRVAGHRVDEVGAAVIAPIASDRGVTGALIVAKSKDAGQFDATDQDLIVGFAGQAALVLQLAEARRYAERLRILEDRQRIGEDLQDSVIKRLFALGLSIQAVAGRVGDSEAKRMITDWVEEIDDIIRDIRDTVFALRRTGLGD